MRRCLKDNGNLIILEFSNPQSGIFQNIYDWYSFRILPKIGKLVANDENSYKYLVESIRMHPNQEKLKSKVIDTPKYQTSLKSGPPHNPVFETKLFIGKKLIDKSEGFKKSDSEKKVATEALKLIESNFHSLEKKRSFIKKIIDNLRN